MPLIYYLCECKNSVSKFFRQASQAPAFFSCEKCGKNAKKTLKAPSSQSKLIVDNGIQARAVEVNLDVIEDIRNRSSKDFKED